MPDIAPEPLHIDRVPHPFAFGSQEASLLKEKLLDAVHRMSACEPTAASDYRASLARLRPHRAEATRLISASYEALGNDREFDKWTMIQLAVELGEPTALQLFGKVLATRTPAEPSASCGGGRAAQVSLLQATAIEGVRRLVASGNREGLAVLLNSARHSNRTVKRAAIQAYLALGGPRARATLLATLPKSDHSWLDIRPLGSGQLPWPTVPQGDRRDRPRGKPGIPAPRIRARR